jgi:hypothetical protein
LNKSFKTLALLLAAISAVPVVATEGDIKPDITGTIGGEITQAAESDEQSTRNKLFSLAFACSRLIDYAPRTIEYAPGTFGSIFNQFGWSMQDIIESLSQTLPDTVDVQSSVQYEVKIRFYKYVYNSIWAEKRPSSILAPKILWMLPIPHDFKEHARKTEDACNATARMHGLKRGMIEPMKSWFPAEAKAKLEEFVQSFTQREKVMLLYSYYVCEYDKPFTEPGDYRAVYCALSKKLAESSSPEERALFKQLYTPEEFEEKLALIKIVQTYNEFIGNNTY